jgi:hypothetical protein
MFAGKRAEVYSWVVATSDQAGVVKNDAVERLRGGGLRSSVIP